MTWTVVLVLTYAVALVVAMTVGRRHRWAAGAATALLTGLAVVAYGNVLVSTGFVVRT